MDKIVEKFGEHELELFVVTPKTFAMYMFQDVQTTTHFYMSMVDGLIFSVKIHKMITFNPSEYDSVINEFKMVMHKLYN